MINNKKLSEDEFFKQREEVLTQWPTGKDIVNLNEAIEYHKSLPPLKNAVNKLKYAKEHNEIYAVCGAGKATMEQHIELYQYTEKEGLADVLGLSPDSMTRLNNYQGAQRALEESIITGESKLNGLPVVNHGVANIRRMVESVNVPILPRYGAADARLCDDTLFAGGCSYTAPDIFMDFWNQHAKVSLEKAVSTHQYVCRLMGYYTEHGVPMMAAAQGLYPAAIPPSLQTANLILSVMLQVEQGVKYISVKCPAHGNLVQDVSSAKVRCELLQEYLNKLGHHDVELFPNSSFSLMQYPVEEGANFAVVFMNTLVGKLIGAQINDFRTIAEAKAIPTKEDMAYSFRTAKAIQNFLQTQKIIIDPKEIDQEAQMEELEVRSILDRIMELGNGDPLVGAAQAVESGVLDNPFAANRAAAGKVMGIKDCEGAIRYYDTGNLPFSKDIVDYHKGKVTERKMKRGYKIDYETLVNDLLAISKGYLVQ